MEIKVGMKFKHITSRGYVGIITDIVNSDIQNKEVYFSWTMNGHETSKNSTTLKLAKRFFKQGDWVIIPETTEFKSDEQIIIVPDKIESKACSCKLDTIMEYGCQCKGF